MRTQPPCRGRCVRRRLRANQGHCRKRGRRGGVCAKGEGQCLVYSLVQQKTSENSGLTPTTYYCLGYTSSLPTPPRSSGFF
eukprot:scaffold108933_cov31-Tisochrysis_lutea.AAC.1